MFRFHGAAYYSQLKSKVGNILDKASALRINLNIVVRHLTALDNTADDIQEARDDNGCDDAEEEDDNEDEEHGEGPDMLQQECKTRWSSTHAMSDSLMTMSLLASFASPERLFRSVGPVKSDLWGRLLDTTLIDVMWAKQAP